MLKKIKFNFIFLIFFKIILILQTPRHRAILMLTTDEVVNWLHSETTAQSKIRTLKIENAGTLSHYNSWRSSDTWDLANEMFAKAKNVNLLLNVFFKC